MAVALNLARARNGDVLSAFIPVVNNRLTRPPPVAWAMTTNGNAIANDSKKEKIHI